MPFLTEHPTACPADTRSTGTFFWGTIPRGRICIMGWGLVEILWTVTGVVVPLLLGTAWAMVGLTPPEFWIARGSYIWGDGVNLAGYVWLAKCC